MIKSTWTRVIAKSITWKVIGICALVGIAWLAGVDAMQIGKITIAYHILTLILYAIHEKVWNSVLWGKRREPQDVYTPNI